jgi:hypothetical protein
MTIATSSAVDPLFGCGRPCGLPKKLDFIPMELQVEFIKVMKILRFD